MIVRKKEKKKKKIHPDERYRVKDCQTAMRDGREYGSAACVARK